MRLFESTTYESTKSPPPPYEHESSREQMEVFSTRRLDSVDAGIQDRSVPACQRRLFPLTWE